MPRLRLLLPLVAALALALAGCSGGGNNTSATPTATSPAATTATGAGGTDAAGASERLQQGTGSVADVAEQAVPSVVKVGVNCQGGDPNNCAGTGSAWLFDKDGHFVTNNHVVTLDNQITQPTNLIVTTDSGGRFDATVVGSDPSSDLAVLQGQADGMTPFELANLDQHRIGDPVVAIGYALDLDGSPSVTSGVISAKQREIQEPTAAITGLVQTDAAINPGNSGGPLLDLSGRVVGVNTATIQSTQGIGFAIGAPMVQAVVSEILSKGSVDRGFLGIGFQEVTPALASQLGLPVQGGIQILQVQPGSPAAQAGLQVGDVIVKLGADNIQFASDLAIALIKESPGAQVDVVYFRGDTQQTTKVTLGTPPS